MKYLFASILLLIVFSGLSLTIDAQSQSREDILKEIRAKRGELQELEKQFLAVSDEDRTAYADFLRQPDTGSVRLLPRELYDSEVYKKNQQSLTMRGGGAYYSFTRLTHEYGYGSDIELDSGNLSVGFAGLDYGMLLKLGDVPLDEVSAESPGARFVFAYEPPGTESEIRTEQHRFGAGVAVNDVVYKSRLPVELNTTYLLRSISYDESNVLVAVRVIRKDGDGSVVLIWKLLKKYPTPSFVRNSTLN